MKRKVEIFDAVLKIKRCNKENKSLHGTIPQKLGCKITSFLLNLHFITLFKLWQQKCTLNMSTNPFNPCNDLIKASLYFDF